MEFRQKIVGSSGVFMLWGVLTSAVLSAEPAGAPAAPPGSGVLEIEGEGIEKLVLQTRQRKLHPLVRPGPRVFLPAGEYRPLQVE
jgi:hypothetical protein